MNPITLLTAMLWLFFVVGLGLRILLRAGEAIRNPLNPVASRWCFVKDNWDTLLIRSAWDCVLFVIWQNNPTIISRILTMFHIPLNFDLPVTDWTAWMFGYLIDSLLDKLGAALAVIPQLKWIGIVIGGTIPQLPSLEFVKRVIEAQKLTTAAAEMTDKAEKANEKKG